MAFHATPKRQHPNMTVPTLSKITALFADRQTEVNLATLDFGGITGFADRQTENLIG